MTWIHLVKLRSVTLSHFLCCWICAVETMAKVVVHSTGLKYRVDNKYRGLLAPNWGFVTLTNFAHWVEFVKNGQHVGVMLMLAPNYCRSKTRSFFKLTNCSLTVFLFFLLLLLMHFMSHYQRTSCDQSVPGTFVAFLAFYALILV